MSATPFGGRWLALGHELFDALRELSADGDGVTRGSYSSAEDAAHMLIANTSSRHGLTVWTDQACNTWIELEGTEPAESSVVIGSHLDSVRQGGNFDGAAGVVAGLVTLLHLADGPRLRRSVRTVAFRGEESAWFGTCYVGSRALVGLLTTEMLDALSTERVPLRVAMAEAGADLDTIQAGLPLIDVNSIAKYFELHIEQGPVLVDAATPLGAVTGIRGNHRYSRVEWSGKAGHSGAVPHSLRRDAVFGAVQWLAEVEDLWHAEESQGADLVVTAGVLGTDPLKHAVTRIPDFVRVSLDIRSVDRSTLRRVSRRVEILAEQIADARGLSVALGQRVETPPAEINKASSEAILEVAAELGHRAIALPSGAGHDAAALAEAGIPISMIFIRNRHGSHNPMEAMDLDDFDAGVEVLLRVVEGVAT